MPSFTQYFHTIRHLKAEQVIGQVQRRVLRPHFTPIGSQPRRALSSSMVSGSALSPAMTGPDTFEFVGESGTLGAGWNDPSKSALWLYNLHYFDDLRRLSWEQRRAWHTALIERWVRENPPAVGAGWAPYPTSLRIVNWIAWDIAGGGLSETARASLADQASWLARNLETHILGNHLFANLKALVFAGSYFSGEHADRWLGIALRRLEPELQEQVLADGGNFELSPMYHAIFLGDLLDLLALGEVYPDRLPARSLGAIRHAAGRMLGWLEVMCHPDGGLSQFNDCADGIAPSLADLAAAGARLGVKQATVGQRIEGHGTRAVHLVESGYVRLEGVGAVTLCDVAAVGPSYLPGHGHADTLSYELSIGEQRTVVNGGTSCYGAGPVRLRERGTASHSTVEVGGANSSEVWSGFRVARRAHPFDVELTRSEDGLILQASHDGYRRLPSRPVHRRSWRIGARSLEIADKVTGSLPARALHILHPDVADALPKGACYRVLQGEERRVPACHSARLGRPRETTAIEVTLVGGEAALRWIWD